MSGEDSHASSRQSSGETSSPTSAQGTNGSKAPLKRTGSLMQRLRAMVSFVSMVRGRDGSNLPSQRDNPNVPAHPYQEGQRSDSPHSPYSEDTLGIRGPVPEDEETPRTGSSASTQPSVSGASTKRRNSFLSRRRPSKMGSSGNGTPTSNVGAPVNLADEFKSDEATYDKEEYLVTPGKESPTSPPAVCDSKFTPTPTKGILKNSSGYFPSSGPYGSNSDYANQQSNARGRHGGRDKALPPPPPPPGPVFPDWNLPANGAASRSRDDGFSQVDNSGGANVKRKTSMLKKMRDRISKQP